jgi:hypothetical protein
MRFVIIVFATSMAASLAFGQTSQVFRLTQHENTQELEEMATTLRGVGNIQQVSIDDINRTVTIAGTAGQIATADWLVHQLDVPANGPLGGVHEYRPSGAGDDVVRVFYVGNASTPQELQEIAVTLRSVADIRQVFVYNALKAVAARGTGQLISLAAWMMDQLDQPAKVPAPSPHEYKLPGDDVARVFELTYPETPRQLQEIVTLIRAVGDIQRLFIYNARRAVVLRATAERIALAAWLVNELDKPVVGQTVKQGGTAPEFQLSDDPENLVRVYYLAGSQSEEAYQKVIDQVRRTARTYRSFIYTALGALVVRGSAGQLAVAEKVIEEMKAQ